MPKIKVKNIPEATRKRICNSVTCSKCPLCAKYYRCLRLDNSETECVVELPNEDFPTNREWLEGLSNEDLARVIACKPFPGYTGLYGMSVSMVKEWLSQPCKSLMEDE